MPTVHPDIRAIDAAIIAVLAGDPILAALMPGGVHWDIAPIGLTRFVTVSQTDHVPTFVFGDGGTDTVAYLIKSISRTSAADAGLDASARIHDLLDEQSLTLTDTGYELMIIRRGRRVRYSEFDTHGQEWQHIGAVYNVMVSTGLVPIS